jgi:hypothetical protein
MDNPARRRLQSTAPGHMHQDTYRCPPAAENGRYRQGGRPPLRPFRIPFYGRCVAGGSPAGIRARLVPIGHGAPLRAPPQAAATLRRGPRGLRPPAPPGGTGATAPRVPMSRSTKYVLLFTARKRSDGGWAVRVPPVGGVLSVGAVAAPGTGPPRLEQNRYFVDLPGPRDRRWCLPLRPGGGRCRGGVSAPAARPRGGSTAASGRTSPAGGLNPHLDRVRAPGGHILRLT